MSEFNPYLALCTTAPPHRRGIRATMFHTTQGIRENSHQLQPHTAGTTFTQGGDSLKPDVYFNTLFAVSGLVRCGRGVRSVQG